MRHPAVGVILFLVGAGGMLLTLFNLGMESAQSYQNLLTGESVSGNSGIIFFVVSAVVAAIGVGLMLLEEPEV